jgi:hypothetical protein
MNNFNIVFTIFIIIIIIVFNTPNSNINEHMTAKAAANPKAVADDAVADKAVAAANTSADKAAVAKTAATAAAADADKADTAAKAAADKATAAKTSADKAAADKAAADKALTAADKALTAAKKAADRALAAAMTASMTASNKAVAAKAAADKAAAAKTSATTAAAAKTAATAAQTAATAAAVAKTAATAAAADADKADTAAKAAADKAASANTSAYKAAADKAAADKALTAAKKAATSAKTAADRALAASKTATNKSTADKAVADKAVAAANKAVTAAKTADKVVADKVVADKAVADKAVANKVVADTAAANILKNQIVQLYSYDNNLIQNQLQKIILPNILLNPTKQDILNISKEIAIQIVNILLVSKDYKDILVKDIITNIEQLMYNSSDIITVYSLKTSLSSSTQITNLNINAKAQSIANELVKSNKFKDQLINDIQISLLKLRFLKLEDSILLTINLLDTLSLFNNTPLYSTLALKILDILPKKLDKIDTISKSITITNTIIDTMSKSDYYKQIILKKQIVEIIQKQIQNQSTNVLKDIINHYGHKNNNLINFLNTKLTNIPPLSENHPPSEIIAVATQIVNTLAASEDYKNMKKSELNNEITLIITSIINKINTNQINTNQNNERINSSIIFDDTTQNNTNQNNEMINSSLMEKSYTIFDEPTQKSINSNPINNLDIIE